MTAEAIPWTLERGVGNYQSSKIHRLAAHKAATAAGRRGIIAIPGAGGTADDANFPGSLGGAGTEWPLDTAAKFQETGDSSDLLRFMVLGHDHEYGNTAACTRITNAIAWAQSVGHFPAGGVDGWAVSGGTHTLLQYVRKHPGVFRTLVLHLPLVDLEYLYDVPLFQAELTAALGYPFAAADEPIRTPNTYRATFARHDMHVLIVYGGADTLTPPEQAEQFIAATGVRSLEMPGKGHTIDPDDFDASVIADFFFEHHRGLGTQTRAASMPLMRTVRATGPGHLWDFSQPDKGTEVADQGTDATRQSGLALTSVGNHYQPGIFDGGNGGYFDPMVSNGTSAKAQVSVLAIWAFPIAFEILFWRGDDSGGDSLFQSVTGDSAGVFLGGSDNANADDVFWGPQGILGTLSTWEDAGVRHRAWTHLLLAVAADSDSAELFVNGQSRGEQVLNSVFDASTGLVVGNDFQGVVSYAAVYTDLADSAWAGIATRHAKAAGVG